MTSYQEDNRIQPQKTTTLKNAKTKQKKHP